jgi:hypothetical protein
MSVILRYRHPARPDEAGISYAPDATYAAALTDRLVRRGFEIVETAPALAAATITEKPRETGEAGEAKR